MFTKCNKCDAIVHDPGTNFECPKCGHPLRSRTAFLERLEAEEEHPPIAQFGSVTPFNIFKGIVSAGCLVAMLSYCLLLFLCSLVFFYAIPTVMAHWQELQAIPFLLIPYPVGLTILQGVAALAYWIFLCLAMIISLVWIIWPERKQLKDSLKDSIRMLRSPSRSNERTIFIVGQVFLAVLFFDLVYYYLIQTGGANPTSPDFEGNPLWENMYGFLNASVWEEIAARITLIGLPLVILKMFEAANDGKLHDMFDDLFLSTKKALKVLWGGHGNFSPLVVGLIVFSSMMFGFAHAPGWDLWKVFPTAVSGLAFGYIYIKKGVHGAIILHFSFDYLGITEDLLIPRTFGAGTALIVISILWMLSGFVYFTFYSSKVFRFFLEPDKGWVHPRTRSLEKKLWDLTGWK